MTRLRALELFAGIGGESLALQTANIRTVAYCEIDPFCQQVLYNNMEQGHLDVAPIFPDVTALSALDVPGGVDMIAGGFPCQGLSSIGVKRGMYRDKRSRLVKHVYRLLDEFENPSYVFLENTPLISRDRNYGNLIKQLQKRNYEIAFVIMGASQVGARHKRLRWFLLARQPMAPPLHFRKRKMEELLQMFNQKVPMRVLPRSPGKAQRSVRTCKVFGNAVCPAQAAEALRILDAQLGQDTESMTKVPLRRMAPLKPVTVGRRGNVYQNQDYDTPNLQCRGGGFNVEPPEPSTSNARLKRVVRPYFSQCMPTPRTGSNCSLCAASFTTRSQHDGGNFLLASREMHDGPVPALPERRRLQVNPEFLATHMGFPSAWINEALVQYGCNQ
jgi:site-specific DNA-cytosine methylase